MGSTTEKWPLAKLAISLLFNYQRMKVIRKKKKQKEEEKERKKERKKEKKKERRLCC